VVVLDRGRVAAEGPIAQLKQPRGRVYELRVKLPSPDVAAVSRDANGADPALTRFVERLRIAGMECHATDDDMMRVFVPGDGGAQALFALAAAESVQVRHLRPSVATLEEVFARAVGDLQT
jgi:hypothetical protein